MKLPVIKFKKLDEKAELPKRGSESAAGYDLHAVLDDDIIIKPCETVKIHTGLASEIPEGFFGAIFARSGLATKQGLRPSNCVGVVDSDYRGEVIVAIYNDSDKERCIRNGDRVAQLVILQFLPFEPIWSDDLSDTNRGSGGFGSTGVR